MQHVIWNSITDFGDSAVGLPLAVLVLLALAASGWKRGAAAWGLAVVCCGATMLALKLAFKVATGPCMAVAAPAAAFSPSGHAALSTVVYGGVAMLGGRPLAPRARGLLALAGACWIALIAFSRIALQAHSPGEVIAGVVVGLAAVGLMAWILGQAEAPPALWPRLAIAAGVALAATYGTHWPIEDTLHSIARVLRQHLIDCPI